MFVPEGKIVRIRLDNQALVRHYLYQHYSHLTLVSHTDLDVKACVGTPPPSRLIDQSSTPIHSGSQ